MNKVILYIKDADNVFQQVDLFEDETISVTSKIQDIRDISKVFTDFSQSFTLPASKKNNKIFKHFYNYFISEGAFDARKKIEAVLEINYIPFRIGKVFLNGVKMKNNKAYAYNVTFFGNTVSLKDALGDDELTDLDLSAFDHAYGVSEVQTGLTTGYFSQSIIYPLITHTQRLYFNSDNNHSSTTIDGDLAYHNGTHSENVALRFDQLKPAIKVKDIIAAIEAKPEYGIDFVNSDFIDTTPMSNLYMWLSKEKGVLGGENSGELVKVLEDWQHASGATIVSISSNGQVVSYSANEDVDNSISARLTITPTTSVNYNIQIILNDSVVSELLNVSGTQILTFTDSNPETQVYNFKFKVSSTSPLAFTPSLRFTANTFDGTDIENLNCNPSQLTIASTILISDVLPKIKVIDFLSGIINMFNLTMYYVDDVGDSNFGKIRLISLDDFYDDNPNIFDITKYVDSSEHDVESTIPFSEIDFEYEKPKTLLMKQHEESFGHIFGDEEFKPTNVDRGKPYKVKLPFEHLKFERLFDEDDNSITSIQWGYSAGDNFKPLTEDEEAGDQPSANYEPVLTKPFLFYGIRVTGLTSGNGINYNTGGTNTELLNYWRPSNTNETGYDVNAPLYSSTNLNSTADRVQQSFLGSAANVGDYVLNVTESQTTRVIAIISSDIIQVADPIFSSGDSFKLYRIPEYTLNFDNEVDEWTLSDYEGNTNSLFKNFYQTYIEDVFNAKKRIFKLTAHLPNSILLNYSLNDRFQIGDKVFTINSIDTNLKTGESKLELLNVL